MSTTIRIAGVATGKNRRVTPSALLEFERTASQGRQRLREAVDLELCGIVCSLGEVVAAAPDAVTEVRGSVLAMDASPA